jgi:dihydroorotate dehydrogenase
MLYLSKHLALASCLRHASGRTTQASYRYYRYSRARTRSYATEAPKLQSKASGYIKVTALAFTACLGYYYVTDTRASVHQWLVVPLIRVIWPDAEDAHGAGVQGLKTLYRFGLNPRERGDPDAAGDLQIEVFGHILDNPLGISSGLDKQAEIPTELFALGPSIVEVGGITPSPQEGNPRPRAFRIPSQSAMINRYGLNSDGAELVAARLRQRVREWAYRNGYGIGEAGEQFVLDGHAGVPPGSLIPGKLLAVQVAKSKSTPDGDIDAIRRDYVAGTTALARYADIIVVNVSCPNATGYRELQQAEPLTKILTGVVEAAKSVDRKTIPAVLVKVSPDEDTEEQVTSISAAVWASGVDGVIVGNTTKKRPSPLPYTSLSKTEAAVMLEQGGYSGPQLFAKTLDLVGKYRRILDRGIQFYTPPEPSQQGDKTDEVEASIERDERNLKGSVESSGQPLIRLPERHSSSDNAGIPKKSEPPAQKVIFCTGGIINGKQALEVLNAGASLAYVYTGKFNFLKPCLLLLTPSSARLRRKWNNYSNEKRDASRDPQVFRRRCSR